MKTLFTTQSEYLQINEYNAKTNRALCTKMSINFEELIIIMIIIIIIIIIIIATITILIMVYSQHYNPKCRRRIKSIKDEEKNLSSKRHYSIGNCLS